MKLAIMQPYFFPYISYFQLIKSVDKFIVYGNVSYRKRSFINRNSLVERGSGEKFYILAPVQAVSSNKKICDVKLLEDNEWKRKLLKTIYMNYKKAPFFSEVYSLLERFIQVGDTDLCSYTTYQLRELCKFIGITTDIVNDDIKYQELEKELDDENLAGGLEYDVKSARVIKLCELEGASVYHNSMGGRELYPKAYFSTKGIDIYFIKPKEMYYQQFTSDYTSYLSIIDMLMHIGKEGVQAKLNECSLV
jgi:hypothetical protein